MSAAVEDPNDAVAGRYRLPLGQFVAARDQLAHQRAEDAEREAGELAGRLPVAEEAAAADQAHAAARAALAELGLEEGSDQPPAHR
jgi:hypothetical protein